MPLQEARVRADAAVWNALIATAGRAGQLQRAFEALEDMQVCWLVHVTRASCRVEQFARFILVEQGHVMPDTMQ